MNRRITRLRLRQPCGDIRRGHQPYRKNRQEAGQQRGFDRPKRPHHSLILTSRLHGDSAIPCWDAKNTALARHRPVQPFPTVDPVSKPLWWRQPFSGSVAGAAHGVVLVTDVDGSFLEPGTRSSSEERAALD